MYKDENTGCEMSVNLEYAAILVGFSVFSVLLGVAASSW
jgi:hypothetical protein